ncbi:MAG: hypothetical protein A3E07_00470 [Candidatus Wildermuthbacteria bacterium RIFCSPHIGHO2_12_FULL_45_9]|uniref:histidine kinase n=1 Tax=Candidatus Wildermuthbacteria bacterium RIFCSPHIGHO2_02_FULL_45_25 TaxID=1802450 RepID=A0A1G2QZQ6_9BACT|nr:MAG: hypothetical protein A2748_00210 [Candidatus Wildermuthbacteria bacterium RIFCSPHIGHO2_01_FULL_45_20]OHA66003.1 MAG: hypothetical protein A3C04_03865 [Candidatus Wildermuthbacteria bacterium RIFCSPHIGHO2_02_FULL_45_25]OHA70759.1 MAG: hypothetical protein A3E07_00470 [Candidatus Wildermuthbacteria bacterium RIFCSPHIGHO2_12_FULL_45_9]
MENSVHGKLSDEKKDKVFSVLWLTNLVRMVASVSLGGVIIFLWAIGVFTLDPRPILWGIIPVYWIITLFGFFLSKKEFWDARFAYIQLGVDVIAITLGLHFVGGALHSDFIFLYVLAVISATLLSLRATVYVSLAAIGLYGSLAFAEHFKIWQAAGEHLHRGFQPDDMIRISIFLLLLGIIAFQSYYFISRVRRAEKETADVKEQFLFRIVHDLRSPMTAMRWILDEYGTPEFLKNHADMKERIFLMQEMNMRLLRLVNDALSIARGNTASIEMKKEQVSISEVLEGLVKDFEAEAQRKKIAIRYENGNKNLAVLGDRARLQEIFSNLIENAIKYNRDGGSVRIFHEMEGGNVKTMVEDTGWGISQESLKKLFTPFFRGDMEQKIEGTGLGLYLVKELVSKMGGQVRMISQENKGSTFVVILPGNA